jgi:catechol 2,3-dioxygenase-like lactoylglutathione lyase family enzyme
MPAPEIPLAPSFVTLAARDLPATVRWYRDVLGFAIVAECPGLNGRPLLTRLRRGPGQDLVLEAPQVDIPETGQGVTVTFVVDEDVNALAARASAAGAVLADTPFLGFRSLHEIGLLDPNGYRLVFVQRR